MRSQHVLCLPLLFVLGCQPKSAALEPVATTPTPATSKAPDYETLYPKLTPEFKALILPQPQPKQWPSVDEFMARLVDGPSSVMVTICDSVELLSTDQTNCSNKHSSDPNEVTIFVSQGNYHLGNATLKHRGDDKPYFPTTSYLFVQSHLSPLSISERGIKWANSNKCEYLCSGQPKPILNGPARESYAYVRTLLEHDEPFYAKNVKVYPKNNTGYIEIVGGRTVDVSPKGKSGPSPYELYPDALERGRHYVKAGSCSRDMGPYKEVLHKAALSAKHGKISWQLQLLTQALSIFEPKVDALNELAPIVNTAAFVFGSMLIAEAQMVHEDSEPKTLSVDHLTVGLGALVLKGEHGAELMRRVEALLKTPQLDALNEYAMLSFLKHQADEGDEAAAAQAKKLLSELKLSNPQLAPLFGLEAKPQ